MRDGLITAILNDCGTCPEMSEFFMTLSSVIFNNGSACFSSVSFDKGSAGLIEFFMTLSSVSFNNGSACFSSVSFDKGSACLSEFFMTLSSRL